MAQDCILREIGEWFDHHNKDPECLLPQNINTSIFSDLLLYAQKNIDKQQHINQGNPLESIIGLFLADENGKFSAHREILDQAIRTYAMNLILEGLRRKQIIQFRLFTLDDVLDMSFERDIKVTEVGKKSLQHLQKLHELTEKSD